jgi:hypothetical protein
MCKDILTRLPKILDKKKAHEDTFKMVEGGQMISLGVFVG